MDFLTTAALAAELRSTVVPSRVQQVVQTDAHSVALELYSGRERHYLLLSADPQAPRAHLLSAKPRRGDEDASPLLQLLRKYVRGARLTALTQPAWERILHFDFQHGEQGATRLTLELIGRWANLLLLRAVTDTTGTTAWRILDCLHRHRATDQAVRAAAPGQWYTPPPAAEGLPPDSLNQAQARQLLAAAGTTPLWRVLVEGLQGISPQAGRALAAQVQTAAGDEAAQADGLLAALAVWLQPLHNEQWQPWVQRNAAGQVTAYGAQMPAAGSEDLQTVAGISQALELAHSPATQAASDGYAVVRHQTGAAIRRAADELSKRRAAIERQLRPRVEIEQLRAAGEWILALSSQIAPRQTVLTLPAEAGLPPVMLDPALSPAKNAAACFKRYHKAQRAAQMAAPRLAALEADRAYLGQLEADLTLASDRSEIDAVRAALAEAGFTRRRKPGRGVASPAPQGPRRFFSVEGYTILVGRNSRQNDHLTFDIAGPDDLWLHARGLPGSHVVIRSGGAAVSEATIAQAARLAAHFSKARPETRAEVIVTERRAVRRAPGRSHPGMVTVSKERVVSVHEPARMEN